MLFYIWYQLPFGMCTFMADHPGWYATLQSLVYILGESAPIVLVLTIQVVFQVYKRRKTGQNS